MAILRERFAGKNNDIFLGYRSRGPRFGCCVGWSYRLRIFVVGKSRAALPSPAAAPVPPVSAERSVVNALRASVLPAFGVWRRPTRQFRSLKTGLVFGELSLRC